MIEVLPAPAHVAAFRVSDTVTGDDYDRVITVVEAKLAAHDRVGLYVDTIGFSDMTAEAIGKRVRYGLGKLGELHRFRRAAVVTDKDWLRTMVSFMANVFPQIEARAFGEREREAALAWASALPG